MSPGASIAIAAASGFFAGGLFGFTAACVMARNSWSDGFRAGLRGCTVQATGEPDGITSARNVRREETTLWNAEDAPLVARMNEAGLWDAVRPEDMAEANAVVNANGGVVWSVAVAIACVIGLLWFANSIFEEEERVTRLRSEANSIYLQKEMQDHSAWKRQAEEQGQTRE